MTTRIYEDSDSVEITSDVEMNMTAYQLKGINLEPAKYAGSFLFSTYIKKVLIFSTQVLTLLKEWL